LFQADNKGRVPNFLAKAICCIFHKMFNFCIKSAASHLQN
jgi:hypothetical protein